MRPTAAARRREPESRRLSPLVDRRWQAPSFPEIDEKLDFARKMLDAVHQQDMHGCANLYRGLKSSMARPGRLSHLEETIWQFENWLLDQMGESA